MNHLYSYKFRLYPTKQQEVLLNNHFGCGRFVYNYFLDKRIQEYKNNKKSISRKDNEKELPILKKENPWLKEVGSQSLQYAVECLQTAYGRELIKVGRYFPSSQLCNNCGHQNKELKPTDKEWFCYNCFENVDRDHNAALNVLEEGLKYRTVGTTELAACPDVRPAISGLLVGAETHPSLAGG